MTPEVQTAMQHGWTPEMIQAVFDGIEKILGAIGLLIVTIIGVWIQVRRNRSEGEKVGAVRDEKLNTIVAQGNGQQAANMARIAYLEALLAKETGRADDRVRAIGAEAEAEIHRKATEVAKDVLREPLAKVKTDTGTGGPEDEDEGE